MAVELDGNVRMPGDNGPGVRVDVIVENRRLRLMAGEELVGDWSLADIVIRPLQESFEVEADGEEFVLRTSDDVALAEEIGVSVALPRLTSSLWHRLRLGDRSGAPEPAAIPPNLAAIGFAVAGALVVLGGVFLDRAAPAPDGFQFWVAFLVGGVLMISIAYVMSIGSRSARLIATGVLVTMIATFGFAVRGQTADVSHLTAYGFVAAGLVVGVAVLVSAGQNQPG